MNIIKQFSTAFNSYFKAFNFINEHKLWLWMAIPGVINLIIYFLIGAVVWSYSDDLTNQIVEYLRLENETGVSILFWTTLILIRTTVLFIFFFIYKYIILILMSPALALFAEKIHRINSGKEIPFKWEIFFNNIFRSVGIAVKNILKEGVLTILALSLSFTGVLVPLVPVLIFMIQSYYYGFSMMDYKNEINGLTIKQSSAFVSNNKGLAIGNGAVFNLLLLIPFLGALIAPMLALVAMSESLKKIG